ncbi:MAG: BamA/TamA family outer membrane protein [Candidatus Latescibacterota bacterium]|nr:BamA/TamA family outer membrane protein [Candidatus Latescibacterota bacterium]
MRRKVVDSRVHYRRCQSLFVVTRCLLLPTWLFADSDVDLPAHEGRNITAVELAGNRFTHSYVVYRELSTRSGQPLSADSLRADLDRLDNLDIFSSVRVRIDDEGGAGIRLVLLLRELPPVVPYISYDVTDQDGWSFGPEVKAVNLLGRDVFLTGNALFGGRTTYLLGFSHPWIAGNHLSVDLDVVGFTRDNELDGFEEESLEITPRIGTWVGRHGRASVAASYLRVSADESGHTLSADDEDVLVRLGGRIGYDSRDRWSNPLRGWWNELELWKTGGLLPGDGDYWSARVDLRRYQPITKRHTLVLASLWSLQSGRVGRDLPSYFDYHLGGANTIRGYLLGDLGPELHGANEWLATLEYRFALVASREIVLFDLTVDFGLAGAVFADSGIAWDDRDEIELSRSRSSAGIGLRLLMPAIDMMRLDLAFGASGAQIHFAAYSKLVAQRFRLR